uniref:Uncharacterized protein n=1 Tax=Kalanchoe fedtschenkoi TaxID=63787 RepID=A0A7N0TDS7_KALFE
MAFSAAAWTALLTATVAVASISAVTAFLSIISDQPRITNGASSCSAMSGDADSSVRLPLDGPMEVLCFPAHMVMRSRTDFVVPHIVVCLLVAFSACVIRAFLVSDG